MRKHESSRSKCQSIYILINGMDTFWHVIIFLAVYPTPQIIPTSRTIFAEFGTTAVLDCSLSPGSLVEQYYATWLNGSSDRLYAIIQRPFFTVNQPTTIPSSSRYFVEPSTLALVISSVLLTDADTSYRCVVGVEDPQNRNIAFTFQRTRNIDITLIVYSEYVNHCPFFPLQWKLG